MTGIVRGAAAALLVLVALPAHAAGDHEMLAAEQEMKIARGHLQAAGTDYGGHRRAAMDHLDDALREIREAIKFSRGEGGGKPGGEHAAKHPAPHPDAAPDDD